MVTMAYKLGVRREEENQKQPFADDFQNRCSKTSQYSQENISVVVFF